MPLNPSLANVNLAHDSKTTIYSAILKQFHFNKLIRSAFYVPTRNRKTNVLNARRRPRKKINLLLVICFPCIHCDWRTLSIQKKEINNLFEKRGFKRRKGYMHVYAENLSIRITMTAFNIKKIVQYRHTYTHTKLKGGLVGYILSRNSELIKCVLNYESV